MTSPNRAPFGARLVMLAIAGLSLSGCATITRGSSQSFTVQSTPPGAQVATSNGFNCKSTPCTFRMPRKDGFRATVSMDGYATQEIDVASAMSGNGAAGMARNLVFGGIVGGVVDANSGAMNDLKPNPLVVVLEPVGAASVSTGASQP